MKRAALLLACCFVAAGAFAITGGSAKGTLRVGSDKIPLTNAYAIQVGSQLRIVVVGSEIEDITADVNTTYLPDSAQGIVLTLNEDGTAGSVFYFHDEIGGVEVRETARFAKTVSERGTLAGRVVMDDPGFSFGFDATFKAPIVAVTPQPVPEEPSPESLPQEERDGALVMAVERGDVAAARGLIKAGAETSQSDDYKQSLVMRAGTNPEMIRLLVDGGADPNAANQWKMTPLMAVAEQGSLESVKVLVDAGAKVNARNTSGMTALAVAAMRGYEEIVAYLLEEGADVKRDTKELLEYAKDHPAIREMISKAAEK